MNRDELAATLARMRQAADGRIAVWRIVINVNREVVRRIFRGYFVLPDDSARRKSSGPNDEDLPEATISK